VHRGKLKGFQEIIAHWLKEMGLIESFEIKELAEGSGYYQALVKIHKNSPPALLTDVGFGVSQVLPIIALLYYVPEKSTVIIEQPEIHLHPMAQSSLADLFINVSERRGLQIIFESHSEHLLLRLQRRIAEGQLNEDDVILHSASYRNRQSRLETLEVDELGQIKNWPQNFMGDAFGETLAAEKARLKRLSA
jgi:predicted ATPase